MTAKEEFVQLIDDNTGKGIPSTETVEKLAALWVKYLSEEGETIRTVYAYKDFQAGMVFMGKLMMKK